MNRLPFAAPRRGFGALCLLASVVALCAACSSSSTPGPAPSAVGGSGAATSTPTSTPTVSASSTAEAAGGVGGTAAASGNPAAASTCLVRYLHGDTGRVGAAAGSVYVTVTFKNLNNKPCTLYGYPGVSAGNGTPVTQVGKPANRNSAVPSTVVTLQPGGYAYTTLQVVNVLNYSDADCKPASTSWLLVYPPNTTNLLYIPYNTKVCTTSTVSMSVQAVQAGQGGA